MRDRKEYLVPGLRWGTVTRWSAVAATATRQWASPAARVSSCHFWSEYIWAMQSELRVRIHLGDTEWRKSQYTSGQCRVTEESVESNGGIRWPRVGSASPAAHVFHQLPSLVRVDMCKNQARQLDRMRTGCNRALQKHPQPL